MFIRQPKMRFGFRMLSAACEQCSHGQMRFAVSRIIAGGRFVMLQRLRGVSTSLGNLTGEHVCLAAQRELDRAETAFPGPQHGLQPAFRVSHAIKDGTVSMTQSRSWSSPASAA